MDYATILKFTVAGIFAGGAVCLAALGKPNWGWFIFAAIAVAAID